MPKREGYISWDEFFMGAAMLCAKRSKDPNTQVGACIVDGNNKIVSVGYNGFPIGIKVGYAVRTIHKNHVCPVRLHRVGERTCVGILAHLIVDDSVKICLNPRYVHIVLVNHLLPL